MENLLSAREMFLDTMPEPCEMSWSTAHQSYVEGEVRHTNCGQEPSSQGDKNLRTWDMRVQWSSPGQQETH